MPLCNTEQQPNPTAKKLIWWERAITKVTIDSVSSGLPSLMLADQAHLFSGSMSSTSPRVTVFPFGRKTDCARSKHVCTYSRDHSERQKVASLRRGLRK